MTTFDGYELYCLLAKGQPYEASVNGRHYRLQFEGVKTCALNWLRLTDDKGESLQLSPGWSSEACWNALTTLEQGRWNNPVGPWKDPSNWSNPESLD